MSNYPLNLSCPFCGTRLSVQEVEYINSNVSVRCRECGSLLSRDQFESVSDSSEVPIYPQRSFSPRYQSPSRSNTGAFVFFIGFIVLSLGLYSWFFYIPIFDTTYLGEILGAAAVLYGLAAIRKEAADPSAFPLMIGGLLLWCAAWFSWIVYIPILSEAFIGEFGGLALIIFGYLKSR
ncbi:MAG: hypothetical protein RTU92_15125 [Candidatus Thorarchaeota archaeon]